MAETQNEKELDELLEDIALEPDNTNDTSETQNSTIDVDSNADLDGFMTEVEADSSSEETVKEEDDPLEELSLDNEDSLEEESSQEEEPENIIDEDMGFGPTDIEVEDEKEYAVQKKQTKLQKILIAVLIGLVALIAIGLVLYLMGVFDPEEEKKPEMVKQVKKTEEKPKYKFKQKDINVDRLNEKLNMLTKYEILESDEKELEKAMERERLYKEEKERLAAEKQAKIDKIKAIESKKYEEQIKAQERENELVERAKIQALKDAKKAQEDALAKKIALNEQIRKEDEMLPQNEDIPTSEEFDSVKNEEKQNMIEESEDSTMTPKENIASNEEQINTPMDMKEETKKLQISTEEDNMVQEEEIIEEEMTKNKMFIKFIVINTNKRDIFKSYLDKILMISDQVKLCRNDQNRVEVFVGPLEEEIRNELLEKFSETFENENPEAIDFTQEEYNQRCNY